MGLENQTTHDMKNTKIWLMKLVRNCNMCARPAKCHRMEMEVDSAFSCSTRNKHKKHHFLVPCLYGKYQFFHKTVGVA